MSDATGHAGGSERFAAGDPLRAIAALSVVVFHVALAVTISQGVVALDAFGEAGRLLFSLDAGLVIFFVLSGYLLTRPFARALVLGERVRAPGYLRRRLARILPAYFALLGATLLVEGLRGAPGSDVLVLGTLTQAWFDTDLELLLTQGWTLSVELAFYLALPVGALAAVLLVRPLRRPGSRAALLVGLVVAGGLLSLLALTMLEGVERRQFPPAHLWAFAPGIALALLEPLRPAQWLPRWTPTALLAAGLAAGVGLLLMSRLREDARMPLVAVAAAAPLAAALVRQWQGRPAWRALDNAALRWLGERSYGIYLWHSFVMWQLLDLVDGRAPWPAFALLAATAIPGTILCAALSWRLIERPAIAWAHRRRAPAEAEPAEAAPAPLAAERTMAGAPS